MRFPLSKHVVIPGNSKPPALPPIRKQAVNYAKAQAARAMEFVRGGEVHRSDEEARRIIEHYCKGHGTGKICPDFRSCDQRCAACGCPVLKRAKIAPMHCPRRYW